MMIRLNLPRCKLNGAHVFCVFMLSFYLVSTSSASDIANYKDNKPYQTDIYDNIKTILSSVEFVIKGSSDSAPFLEGIEYFCEEFLSSLYKGEGIQIVPPLFVTDNYNAPELEAYKKLTIQPLNRYQDHFRKFTYARSNFRIYELNFDGDIENGKEIIFYGDDWKISSRYKILQKKQGKLIQIDDISSWRTVENFKKIENRISEIIRYKDFKSIYFVLTVVETYIFLSLPNNIRGGKGHSVCTYIDKRSANP